MSKSVSRRLDILTQRLQGRTNHLGEPLPGYKENVAALRAEIALLTEQLEAEKDN